MNYRLIGKIISILFNLFGLANSNKNYRPTEDDDCDKTWF